MQQLVGVYADEGVTGTSTTKREGFNQLMNDCLAGKVDMVITKSVTRFARNTLDSIKWIRKLKDIDVDVYFEIENLHSLTSSEMVLTILSSVSQESSQTKSESVRWGYARQFENGKTYLGNLYGYKSQGGAYYILEEEAAIVREIYEMYLAGSSEIAIARNLTERKIPTKQGKNCWITGVVQRILQNEKYCGDSLQGKTFNKDCLNQKRLKNIGQRKMYYIEESHQGIISKEVFKEAQIERARRKSKLKMSKYVESRKNSSSNNKSLKRDKRGRYSSINILSNCMICGECGSCYRRVVWTMRSGKKQAVWRCANKLDNGKEHCSKSRSLKEELLFKEIAKIINKIFDGKSEVKRNLAKKVSQYLNPKDLTNIISKYENELNEIDKQIKETIEQGEVWISRGVQDEGHLKEHLNTLYSSRKELTEKLNETKIKLNDLRKTKEDNMLKTLRDIDVSVSCLTQEDIAIFVDEIIIYLYYIEVVTKLGKKYKISIDKVV